MQRRGCVFQAGRPAGERRWRIADLSACVAERADDPERGVAAGFAAGGRPAAYVTVGAKQTTMVNATLTVGGGQVAPPGTYSDTLALGIYQSPGGGPYARAPVPAPALGVTIVVNSQMTLAIAGGGRNTTMNFGDLVEGATRSVQLLAYSNQSFHLTVSSDNGGVMRPVDAAALAEGQWRVPYTIAILKTAPVDLSQQRTISLWPASDAEVRRLPFPSTCRSAPSRASAPASTATSLRSQSTPARSAVARVLRDRRTHIQIKARCCSQGIFHKMTPE